MKVWVIAMRNKDTNKIEDLDTNGREKYKFPAYANIHDAEVDRDALTAIIKHLFPKGIPVTYEILPIEADQALLEFVGFHIF